MNQPFCSPVKALRSVLDAAALLPSPSPETIPLEAACGRIAAADLCARMDAHRAGKTNAMTKLWAFYCFIEWYEVYFTGKIPPDL